MSQAKHVGRGDAARRRSRAAVSAARSSNRGAVGDKYRCTWSVADAFTLALAYVRTSTSDSAAIQSMANAHFAQVAARRRGAPAFGQIIMNSAIRRHLRTAAAVRWLMGFAIPIRAAFRGFAARGNAKKA